MSGKWLFGREFVDGNKSNIVRKTIKGNYIITHNVIDGGDNRKRTAAETADFPHYFELYDDDNILYARGYSNDNQTEKLFKPLDNWGAAYGCTGIKMRNAETNTMVFV